MMTDTSFFTFSAGRVETRSWDGSRLRPSGSVLVVFGLASAKQTLLPPGEAVYAPQSPYWPSKVGCASPAAAAGAAAVASGLAGAAAGFCGAAAGVCGCGVAAGFGGGCLAEGARGRAAAKGKGGVGELLPPLRPPPDPPPPIRGEPPTAQTCLGNLPTSS